MYPYAPLTIMKVNKTAQNTRPRRLPLPKRHTVFSQSSHTGELTPHFLVAAVDTLNTKTHPLKEIAEFSFENADVQSFSIHPLLATTASCHFLQNVWKQNSVSRDRLVGLIVKASASRAEDPGFQSHLCQDFFGVESYQ